MLASLVLGCAPGCQGVEAPAPPCARPMATARQVPRVAPDTLPLWVNADSSYVTGVLKRIIAISFTAGATQAQRQCAIARVGGTVIGGTGIDGEDGDYFVMIPGATTVAQLDSLAAVAQAQPSVAMASIVPGIKMQ